MDGLSVACLSADRPPSANPPLWTVEPFAHGTGIPNVGSQMPAGVANRPNRIGRGLPCQ